MVKRQILCNKCKKDITEFNKTNVIIGNYDKMDDPFYKFEFCDDCYGNFIRTVGSWIKDE